MVGIRILYSEHQNIILLFLSTAFIFKSRKSLDFV